MSAARRAARSKPVIVIKAGRHAEGAKAAASHTGALAGADAVYEAAFRRAGLLRVYDLDELFDAAEILSHLGSLPGERLAVLTNGGGAGVLAADSAGRLPRTAGASLGRRPSPRSTRSCRPPGRRGNPVDIIGDAQPERYRDAIDVLLQDKNTDAILVINCPTALASSTDAAKAMLATVESRKVSGRPTKPLLANWLGEGAAEGRPQAVRGRRAFRASTRPATPCAASCSSCTIRRPSAP